MKVSNKMTRDLRIASLEDSIQDAARSMAECDSGVLPVGENDHLVGMVMDRDITVRGVAEGKSPDAKVREVMTADIKYCFEDEDLDHVARNMAEQQVRRLPVMSRDKRLVGILSLGDISLGEGAMPALAALSGISQPRGEHSQTGGPRS